MAVLTKTIADIVTEWERTEPIHLYPPFSIEWGIRKLACMALETDREGDAGRI